MTIASGTKLGRYEVRSKIGAGGMGEVYLAEDTKLERTVALKILPAGVVADQDRMNRFVQEAKAASALNHPNIVTIYEIGQIESVHFIATELIEGVTLREQMATTRMKLGEVLNIAVQAAGALAAAHAAGIVHRDIKPENIMLRQDGYVKVLDFGLAKMTREATGRKLVDSAASTLIDTEPGIVLGTVNYMSPDQARGLKVDARTDIWSLAVVLYEMIAGRAPFEGSTSSDIIVSILEREPLPLTYYSPGAPAELQRILMKALAKDTEERYQTAKDLRIDLTNLRRELELEARLAQSVQPASSGTAPVATSGGPVTRDAKTSASLAAEAGATRPSSAEYIAGEIKRHKKSMAVAALILIVALLGIGYATYRFLGQRKSIASFEAMRLTKLTTTGKIKDAAISPDGKYVVYFIDSGGGQSLWIRHVATTGNVQIIPPARASVTYYYLIFSPDSNYIYYVMYEPGSTGVLYQIAVLGGTSRKVMANVDSRISFSPDGQRFGFVRYPKQGESALMMANADGSGEHMLATRKSPSFLTAAAAWSPDGKVIVGASLDAAGKTTLFEVGAADGKEKQIGSQKWEYFDHTVWLGDGSGLIIASTNQETDHYQVWQVSYPDGEARRITNDLNDYWSISLTADSNSLVTLQGDRLSNIWVAPSGDSSQAKQITTTNGDRRPSWMPDGKILYLSSADGNQGVSIMEGDGSNQKRLTPTSQMSAYASGCPDGRYIVFTSGNGIWRMDIDGGNPKMLTSQGWGPRCSPDGRWVIFYFMGNLLKLPIDGGEPVRLAEQGSAEPAISPDGKLIAYSYQDQQQHKKRIAIISFEGGQPVKTFDIAPTVQSFGLRWTADGRALTYVDTRKGVSNIWIQPIDGSAPKQLTDFKSDLIFSFDWSRDGKQLVLSRGARTSDVVLISNFK